MMTCPKRPAAFHPSGKGCGSSTIVVTVRNANFSAFNGRRRTWSRYSQLKCLDCGYLWRSAADGVHRVRDATDAEITAPPRKR